MTEQRYKSAKRVLKVVILVVLEATAIVALLAGADWAWTQAQAPMEQVQSQPPTVQFISTNTTFYGTGIKVAPNQT